MVRYKLDTSAQSEPHWRTVVQLPPYHCNFSVIEFIWAQVTNDVAKYNVSFKSSEVIKLFEEALSKFTPENWKNACEHVKKEEDFLLGKGWND